MKPFTRTAILKVVSIPLLFILIGGCTSSGARKIDVKPAQRIKITGSQTCVPLLKILAEKYHQDHTNVEIAFLPGAHSASAIDGLKNGIVEIGAISRPLSADEQKLGFTYVKLSDDALTVAIDRKLPIDNLSSDAVRGIYSGTITNWSALGGPDKPILVLDRAEDESAKIILREYLLGKDLATVSSASVMFLETDMVKALETSTGAIGYLSFGYAISQELPIRLVSVDGVKPSVENVDNGSYKMVRPMGIIYKGPLDSTTKDFILYLTSKEAAKVLESNGYAKAH